MQSSGPAPGPARSLASALARGSREPSSSEREADVCVKIGQQLRSPARPAGAGVPLLIQRWNLWGKPPRAKCQSYQDTPMDTPRVPQEEDGFCLKILVDTLSVPRSPYRKPSRFLVREGGGGSWACRCCWEQGGGLWPSLCQLCARSPDRKGTRRGQVHSREEGVSGWVPSSWHSLLFLAESV